ncbi:nuclear transport factor 2 family protein [bacterium]|nr:nuclear transport factor 2 family protein [bacterium]
MSMYFKHRPVSMTLASIGILFFGSVAGGFNAVDAKSSSSRSKTNQASAANAEAIKAEDEATIREQANQYALSYGKGDAKALASQWSTDGSLTEASGKKLHGREQIEKSFAHLFRAHSLEPLVIEVESVKFPANNIAIEVGSSKLPSGSTRYTAIHSKEGGHWQMISVFEHDLPSKSSEIPISELSWMVGSWGAKSNSDLRVQCEYTANKKFLLVNFYSSKADNNGPSETEIIGWNPVLNSICSWHYNNDGGLGMGRWKKDGDSWLVNARGSDHEGSLARAQYILHKVDDNNYTWKSTKRFSQGKSLPDTQEILVMRRDSN